MNYKSQIKIMQDELEVKIEKEVLKTVAHIGINVNKEELLKALEYDRKQYQSGYDDGFESAREVYEKALGKACEILEDLSRFTKHGTILRTKEQWREWCMKDGE